MDKKVNNAIVNNVGKWMFIDTSNIKGKGIDQFEQRVPFKHYGQWCIRYKSFVYPIIDTYEYHNMTVLVPSCENHLQYKQLV